MKALKLEEAVSPHWLAGMSFVCAWSTFVAVGGQLPAAEEITTFKQFYQLSREQSGEGRPVRFRGVVLCYDLEWGQLHVHDGSEVRYFNPREIPAQAASGQLVEITGTTTVVGNDNALTNLNLMVLKPGALPAAIAHVPAQLTNDLGQWVETSGRVRVVDFSRQRTQLSLCGDGQSCEVIVLGVPQTNEVRRLVGARVRVRGINNTQVADGRLDLVSVMVPGMEEVAVLEPARANQVLPRAMSIDSLLNRELGDWTNSPVRISGLVVSSEPRKMLKVKDPTGVIRAQVIQSTVTGIDDRVDVCGFLKVTPNETLLSDAWFEVIKATPLAAAAATASSLPAATVRPPEVLTRVSEIRKLRKEDAMQRWPVRLQGVILYADPEWRNGFLQAQRGAVYFDVGQADVRSGQWVELTGETGPGGFAQEVLNTSVKVLGMTNLPMAAKVDLADLGEGHLDAQWVEMEGVIRRVKLEEGHLRLRVMTPKGRFNALIPGWQSQAAPTHLIDAFVSIQGACASEMNAHRQVIGVTLHVPGLERIKILEAAPANPFAVAATPVASVSTFDPDRQAGRRVKVSGVVTLKVPDQGFFIQDPSGGIFVRQGQRNELQCGDVLEVMGFPVMGDSAPELEEVTVYPTGGTSNIVARETTAEEILLHAAHDGALVTLEARLLQSVPHSANPQLVVQDGAIIFTARLEDAGQGWRMPALESGSVVRLSGVCSIQGGEQHEPKNFRLRLRSPADVTLISSPPWLTARRKLWVLGGFGATFVIVMAWVVALRGQVARQTRTLREQLAERERMQEQIEKSHKELLAVSRQAGMAEIATNVLHNVGNVLNSVNVSTGLIFESVKKSRAPSLARVVTLLEEHAQDLGAFITQDPRGKHVPAHLAKLAKHLQAEQEVNARELELLRRNVEHIKGIVAIQQNNAAFGGVKEMVNLVNLVEDSLHLNESALRRHEVEVVREFEPVPTLNADKHRLLQILVNLLRNAKHACQQSERADKRVTVRVTNGDGRVRVSVIDNGVGIPPENLTRIFNHGFTTRRDGHGFGLHSGALAAKEMGGSLTVHSDGIGHGAAFTLELPLPSPGGMHG